MSDQTEKADVASLNDSVSFDFISSEDLRKSLENDYSELMQAISAKMWKSACILAGSIAEAVLMDYIAVLGNCTSGVDELAAPNIVLGKLIDAAIGIDVLVNAQPPGSGWNLDQLADAGLAARASGSNTLRTVYRMSSAVADFRNLIHPGRALRLKEHVNDNLALAARAFVLQLCSDLSKESAERYPYRAEGIMDKAQKDASARTILETMLHKTRPAEVDRLLTDVCPRAFLADYHRPVDLLAAMNSTPDIFDGEDVENYEPICEAAEVSRKADAMVYRVAFDWSTTAQKCSGLHAIARLLTTAESGAVVKVETELLQMADLKYASDEDGRLIVGDVLDRICSPNAERSLLDSVSGIGVWIVPERAAEFTKALLEKMFLPKVEAGIRRSALTLLENEYENMSKSTQEVVRKATNTYRNSTAAFTKNSKEDVQAIDDLVAYWDSLPHLVDFDDLPHPPSS